MEENRNTQRSTRPRTTSNQARRTTSSNSRSRNTSSAKRTNNTRRRKRNTGNIFVQTLIYIGFVLGVSAILSLVAVKWSNDVFAFSKADEEITIKIPIGSTVKDVSKILDDAGVIEYSSIFKLFVNVSAKNSEFTAGTHVLNSNMDYRGLLNDLAKTTSESLSTVDVTIPEGYTIDQIAVKLEESGVVSAEDFYDTVINYEFSHDFLTTNPDVIYQLEGYLFPDTYQFYENENPVSVVNKMLNNFGSKIEGNVKDYAEELGLTIHEVVTIASLVEREAAKQDEQQKISGVIHNRLNNSSQYPYLNIDATIQYASGHRENILQSDLDTDGPYNTYTRKGLPAGPIANPGLNTLLAAVKPESHGYYFYVAKADGYHIFTTNYADHQAAIIQARSE